MAATANHASEQPDEQQKNASLLMHGQQLDPQTQKQILIAAGMTNTGFSNAQPVTFQEFFPGFTQALMQNHSIKRPAASGNSMHNLCTIPACQCPLSSSFHLQAFATTNNPGRPPMNPEAPTSSFPPYFQQRASSAPANMHASVTPPPSSTSSSSGSATISKSSSPASVHAAINLAIASAFASHSRAAAERLSSYNQSPLGAATPLPALVGADGNLYDARGYRLDQEAVYGSVAHFSATYRPGPHSSQSYDPMQGYHAPPSDKRRTKTTFDTYMVHFKQESDVATDIESDHSQARAPSEASSSSKLNRVKQQDFKKKVRHHFVLESSKYFIANRQSTRSMARACAVPSKSTLSDQDYEEAFRKPPTTADYQYNHQFVPDDISTATSWPHEASPFKMCAAGHQSHIILTDSLRLNDLFQQHQTAPGTIASAASGHDLDGLFPEDVYVDYGALTREALDLTVRNLTQSAPFL
ncbi:hypothetical protein BC830DRAFT_1128527 [Chytriomyces sp. MP71]|nr:hypothetical protein BC830DRAFT_1128527 [Chytriomyces sp. MP71]